MPSRLPLNLPSYLAWRFDDVRPGTFKRNKAAFAHHSYPILAPLPSDGIKTVPIEIAKQSGPYIYFVCDAGGLVRYVGKSLEENVLKRWIRPGNGGPATHYWTHSTEAGGNVFEIARRIQAGESSHFDLRYVPLAELTAEHLEWLGIRRVDDPVAMAAFVEAALIKVIGPDWNRP